MSALAERPGVVGWLRRRRGWVALGVLVLLVAVGLALTAADQRSGRLDPRAVDRSGSRAVAALLEAQGVEVTLVQTTDQAVTAARPGDTLLVADPALLVPAQLDRLAASPADIVLVQPLDDALEALAPWAHAEDQANDSRVSPLCQEPAAARAGRTRLPGVVYSAAAAPDGVEQFLCYPHGDEAALLGRTTGDRRVVLLGSADPLTNEHLDDEGNAALALDLLGASPRLVWYLPAPDDVPESARRSVSSLLPDGVLFGIGQALVAVLVTALWRARRLGPVVAEPLPVVVPAAETVEGRARLYRRGRARERAATVLRAAARDRLVVALGLPRGAAPGEVVAAVSRSVARPPVEVGALLYGAEPDTDASLAGLAGALDALEQEVRTT